MDEAKISYSFVFYDFLSTNKLDRFMHDEFVFTYLFGLTTIFLGLPVHWHLDSDVATPQL